MERQKFEVTEGSEGENGDENVDEMQDKQSLSTAEEMLNVKSAD